MTKCDTISAITKLNATAAPEFLAEFTNEELTVYLQRLMKVCGVTAGADTLLGAVAQAVGSPQACIE